MHVILAYNGRSSRLGMREVVVVAQVHSVRCLHEHLSGLPRSGGLSYGSTYMGLIGIIMMPTFDVRRYSELPFSSTLNGSCTNVCPVKNQHPRTDLCLARSYGREIPRFSWSRKKL